MTQTALKKEIYKIIDSIEDANLLEAIYTILNNSQNTNTYEPSEEDWKVIEERRVQYEAGKLKTYTLKEVKKKIQKDLSK